MNSGWSNVKLRGSIDYGISRIYYPQKGDKTRNIRKLKSSDLELRFERYPYFKISKNLNLNWAKMKIKTNFKAKLTF